MVKKIDVMMLGTSTPSTSNDRACHMFNATSSNAI